MHMCVNPTLQCTAARTGESSNHEISAPAYDVSTTKVFIRYKTVLYLMKAFAVKTSYATVNCYVKAHQRNSAKESKSPFCMGHS